jgi:epsilon-lactone hydrolase
MSSISKMRSRFLASYGLIAALALMGPKVMPAAPSSAPPHASVTVAADGTVTIGTQSIPQSNLLSPEGRAYVTQHLKEEQAPRRAGADNGIPAALRPYLRQQRSMFPVDLEDTRIGGVHVYVFTPKAGVQAANEKRVLVNLHGGGFAGCWPGCALMESIPIASLGKIKVVSVDYREGPDHRYPAATEDVATVYAQLLKQYSPKAIGIYGCSAGGLLTSEAIAWFEKNRTPLPGAIGMFCSGAGDIYSGDSLYLATPLGQGRLFDGHAPGLTGAYWDGVDPHDPLVEQIDHPDVLARFPPTLFITGTRDMAFSNAIHTDIQLEMAGVPTKLLVWDGLFHGFFYDPSIPESQQVYRAIVRFFDRELAH